MANGFYKPMSFSRCTKSQCCPSIGSLAHDARLILWFGLLQVVALPAEIRGLRLIGAPNQGLPRTLPFLRFVIQRLSSPSINIVRSSVDMRTGAAASGL